MDPLRLFLALLRLHILMILILIVIVNETLIESFRHSSKPPQKVDLDLKTSSRPRPRRSTMVSLTWNVTTYASNVKIILPPMKLLDQTKFRLQPFSFEIGSISIGNNINKS